MGGEVRVGTARRDRSVGREAEGTGRDIHSVLLAQTSVLTFRLSVKLRLSLIGEVSLIRLIY